MKEWQLQEAKARLSELIRLTKIEGTQKITVHGKDEVFVVPKKEYERLTQPKQSFLEFINKSPIKKVTLDISRNTSKPRRIDL